jgi:hypothetical protein
MRAFLRPIETSNFIATRSGASSSTAIDVDNESQQSTPTSSATPSPSPTTSHRCQFDFNETELWYENKKLRNLRYRPREKRSLHKRVIAQASWIWDYGADVTADGYPKLFICKLCWEKRAYRNCVFNAIATSSASSHLQKEHHIYPSEAQKLKSSQGFKPKPPTVTAPPFHDLQYKENFINWVVRHDISFEAASDEDSRKFFAAGREEILKCLPESNGCVSDWIRDAFNERKVSIQDLINGARGKINLSFDAWKSPNKKEYIAVVGHFLDHNYNMIHVLLGLPRIKGGKNGENEGGIITEVIQAWNISKDNIGACMADNAGDNNTAMVEIARRLDLPPSWPKYARMRCLGHIINLVVQGLLFGSRLGQLIKEVADADDDEEFNIWLKEGAIGKAHNLCIYININDGRREEFRECQRNSKEAEDSRAPLEIELFNLIVDRGVKWNSVEDMVERG